MSLSSFCCILKSNPMIVSHKIDDFTSSELNNNTLVTRLERNLKDVHQLRSKLNSYSCEPQTYSLFERIESLKNGLENLIRTDQEIITALKERKKAAQEFVERVKQQYSEFNKLQQGVEEYMGLTRSRYIHS